MYWTLQLAPGVDAFQARLTLLSVLLGELRPVGTLGSVLHDAGGFVLTEKAALCADALPALSRARSL